MEEGCIVASAIYYTFYFSAFGILPLALMSVVDRELM